MSPTASANEGVGGWGSGVGYASPAPDPRPPIADPAAPAIETVGLRKEYGARAVVHDLSLTVRPGEVFGFLGPNGAGKTTTIKILLGLVRPTSGDARIFGRPVGDRLTRRRVGYLPENFRFHDWLTGEGLLDFHGRLAGLSAEERRARIPVVIRRVGLAGRGGDRVRGYSKGMTQRIGLAQAILGAPDLVLLDEPTSALDPIGRREVRDLIRSLRDEGVTVFLNSHLLGEVEMVCDRVAVVDRGRVVGSGRLDEMVGGVSEIRLTVDRADRDLLAALGRHAEVLAIVDATVGAGCWVLGVGEEGTAAPTPNPRPPTPSTQHPTPTVAVTLGVTDLEVAPLIAEAVVRSGARLFGLVPVQRSLEDVFVGLVDGHDGQP